MSQAGSGAPGQPPGTSGGQDASSTSASPVPGNQFDEDPLLRSWLARALPAQVLDDGLRQELHELGEIAGGELYRLQFADRHDEPVLTQCDALGRRVDEVTTSPLWREAQRVAVRHGLVATGYDAALGRRARLAQFLKVYLFHASSGCYTYPLATSDAAVRCLLASGNQELITRAVPRLTSRDPATCWTSDQWLTETAGGSDIGLTETRALRDGNGGWRLHGRKSFTTAATSQMALTLARPEGNPPGARGLALFYVEVRDAAGRLNHLRIDRLEDKLGTRRLPTAELHLDGTHAELVSDMTNGAQAIEPLLAVTRTWNSVCAVAAMRRSIALERAYAGFQQAPGPSFARLPLHADTLATLEAETWGAFLLTFQLVALGGREAAGSIDGQQRALLQLLTPLAKLATAKQAVTVVTECVESFGAMGYLEDTGLPQLLRDTHMLPVWEGTTDAIALDALLRADLHAGLAALMGRASACLRTVKSPRLAAAAQQAVGAVERAALLLESGPDATVLQAGARRIAFTLARALQLALLCEHAQWMLDHGGDRRGHAAAIRFAQQPVDLMTEVDPAADLLLLG